MVNSSQLESRNFWVKLEHPELNDTIMYPGSISGMELAPPRLYRRAPLIGEHNEDIYAKELGLSKKETALLKQASVI